MQISMHDKITEQEVIDLDKANTWSSAEKTRQRMAALRNFHSLVTARAAGKLIGIGNAISDGYLREYLPPLLVAPMSQGQGVGRGVMAAMLEKYAGFHRQMPTAEGKAIEFCESVGFVRAGKTEPMGIHAGNQY